MSPRSRPVLDQTGRRASCRAHWFESAICYRFWLRVSLRGVPESPVFSSGSRADPPLLSMLEVAQTQPQPFWLFRRPEPRFTSFRRCIIARLPDYPVGMVWESSGVLKGLSSSIGKQNSPREPGGRVFEVITESPTLSAAWDTGLTVLRTLGSRLFDDAAEGERNQEGAHRAHPLP